MPGKRFLTFACTLTALALLCVVAFVFDFLWSAVDPTDSAPLTELDVEVVGSDYRLHFRYPGKDRALHTQDDRQGVQNLYVAAGAVVRLHLNSLDYIYTVEIPEAGVYDVAVPDLVFDVQFVISEIGEYELLGTQMCGYDHPGLLGRVIVLPDSQFKRTMDQLPPAPARMLEESDQNDEAI